MGLSCLIRIPPRAMKFCVAVAVKVGECFASDVARVHSTQVREMWIAVLYFSKGRFTRYDFVAYNLLTTRLRHILGHDCRKVVKHVVSVP